MLPPADPIRNPDNCLSWLEWYLLPRGLGGGGARAHQFTINGLTYPFVRHYNFAAVPDPPTARRYDMYSGLHLPTPGDLLFFFQADPQNPKGGINSRRGICGLYRVRGIPYRAVSDVTDAVSGVGYRILHRCPACGTHHATFASSCPLCNVVYPMASVDGIGDVPTRVLSSHIEIEPIYVFERSVSDERVYADLSDPGLVWVGRHDNAMGAGKGSSIRHLLPEEAIKIVRLLISELGQSLGAISKYVEPTGPPLAHMDGYSIDLMPTYRYRVVAREDELYFIVTRHLQIQHSPFRRALDSHLPSGISWDHLEYASSTFPWGYTAGTADYVLSFRNETGRRFIVIIECKPATAHDETVVQVMLYVERVLQVMFSSAHSSMVPTRDRPVEILPVVMARAARTPRSRDSRVAIPQPYHLTRSYFGGVTVNATVRSPIFLRYVPPSAAEGLPNDMCPLAGFEFLPLESRKMASIKWVPDVGAVGTAVEKNFVLKGSWAEARRVAGL